MTNEELVRPLMIGKIVLKDQGPDDTKGPKKLNIQEPPHKPLQEVGRVLRPAPVKALEIKPVEPVKSKPAVKRLDIKEPDPDDPTTEDIEEFKDNDDQWLGAVTLNVKTGPRPLNITAPPPSSAQAATSAKLEAFKKMFTPALKGQATVVASETISPEERAKYPTLSDAKINRLKRIIASTDITDRTATMDYGVLESQNMSRVVDVLVRHSIDARSDGVHAKTKELMELFERSKKVLAGGVMMMFTNPILALREINSAVDRTIPELTAQIDRFKAGFGALDTLYDDVKIQHMDLEVMIFAGKALIERFDVEKLPGLQAQAQSPDHLVVQRASDAASAYSRFKKKVGDLETLSMNAMLNAKQIRMAQETSLASIDGLHNLIFSTIPMWRTHLVGALTSKTFSDDFINTNSAIVDSMRRLLQPWGDN